MKLYYDTLKDEIVEAGRIDKYLITRDTNGDTDMVNDINQLVLLGDIYDEPIDLKGNKLRLCKIVDGEEIFILEGIAMYGKIEEGLRFFIQGYRAFDYYSTNIVVSTELLANDSIVFHTLSGSLYSLDIL